MLKTRNVVPRVSLFRAAFLLAAALIILLLLFFDFSNRGLIWGVLWRVTGEQSPFGQLRGVVDWAGNLTRAPLDLQPDTPIAHTDVNPFGVNTFLEDEVEVAKVEQQLQLISDAGFRWIRQQFVWQDIEIHGRGDFEDRRTVPFRDSWEKYDIIVRLAEQYGLDIQVRLDNPPDWSQSIPGDFAPPTDVQDFVNFAATVARRYPQLRYFQVWNEPNIYPEWGEQNVNPEAYTDMLCRTYAALKAVNPEIVVISGALAQTVELSGRNLSDLVFLQRMYNAGAGECFDIMAAQAYGFFSGPTDQRLRAFDTTFARNLYIRDLMVRNGDAGKPIWISEAAWNPIDSPEVPADVVGRANYGIVTQGQAAEFITGGYERALQEWPWVGVVNYWFFKQPDYRRQNQAMYYFRMLEPDFTPLPVYNALHDYVNNYSDTPILYPGVHQAEHWAVTAENSELVAADGAQFDEAVRATALTFRAHGTNIAIRWQGDALPTLFVNDMQQAASSLSAEAGWRTLHVSLNGDENGNSVHLETSGSTLIDSIHVVDWTNTARIPLLFVGIALGSLTLFIIGSALWQRFHP